MSHIKNYLDEKLAEAEVLTTEIEARHHLATEIGGIDDPDILAGILSDPIAQPASDSEGA